MPEFSVSTTVSAGSSAASLRIATGMFAEVAPEPTATVPELAMVKSPPLPSVAVPPTV